jgi:hypothetical protein
MFKRLRETFDFFKALGRVRPTMDPRSAERIVQQYSLVLQSPRSDALAFARDERTLPHSKATIKEALRSLVFELHGPNGAAMEDVMRRATNQGALEMARTGYSMLGLFQDLRRLGGDQVAALGLAQQELPSLTLEFDAMAADAATWTSRSTDPEVARA